MSRFQISNFQKTSDLPYTIKSRELLEPNSVKQSETYWTELAQFRTNKLNKLDLYIVLIVNYVFCSSLRTTFSS